MSTLALFWPMPEWARLGDPLRRRRGQIAPFTASDLRAQILGDLDLNSEATSEVAASHWFEAVRRPGSFPDGLSDEQMRQAFNGTVRDDELTEAFGEDREASTAGAGSIDPEDGGRSARDRHVQFALTVRGSGQDRVLTDDVREKVADLAAHSPANTAYRALARLVGGWDSTDSFCGQKDCTHEECVTEGGLWSAGVRLAAALRTLFARPETISLLLQLMPDDEPYWRKVLRYSAWGNLQAVLDEYVHHLHVALGGPKVNDAILMEIAAMAAVAPEIRPGQVHLFDPDGHDGIGGTRQLIGRFAVRFGGRRENEESARQPQVRQAFNSPFHPFVLASTSVGQEGVDFHWWSRAVFHWNTPANPIDFEQREGRVDRYDGLAVRRNLAAKLGDQVLSDGADNPWHQIYAKAEQDTGDLGSFAPHWVYPGDSLIERHVLPYPLSVDQTRLDDIKRDVALYRLTFGQPRQEDMLSLLKANVEEADAISVERLRVDLSAPLFNGESQG